MTSSAQASDTVPRLSARVRACRADVAIVTCVVLGTLLLYTYTTVRYGHTFFTSDAYLGYTHAHSWYFDGDADYANNMLAAPGFDTAAYFASRRSPNGHVVHFWPCGWSVVALPFLALADAATIAHNTLFDGTIPRDGFSIYYRTIVPLAHVLLGIAGLLAAYALAARYVERSKAAVATAVVWLGTNVGYFIGVEPTMAHAASMAFVTMMLWSVDTIRRSGWSLRRAIGLGLCGGMMVAVRHQNIVWTVVPIVVLLLPLLRRTGSGASSSSAEGASNPGEPRGLKPGARGGEENWSVRGRSRERRMGSSAWRQLGFISIACGIAGLCLIPQLLTNLAIEGRVFGEVRTHLPLWGRPRFWTELLDPRLGLLRQYPLVALCTVGLVAAAATKTPRRMWLAWLGGFGLLIYMHACWPYGAVGHTRRYVCCAALLVLGLAVVLEWASRRRGRVVLVGMLLTILCARNVALQILVDRQIVARKVINNGGPVDATPHDEDGQVLTVSAGLQRLMRRLIRDSDANAAG